MSKKSVFMCVLCILMAAYYGFALVVTSHMSADARLSGVRVTLTDPNSKFVNVQDVYAEANLDPDSVPGKLCRAFDLYGLEKRLNDSDKLQSANATVHFNGLVDIVVTPMVPVARVFEPGKPSYYINATGKRISAELRYHIDVPVLVGTFDSVHPASRLLPLLDYISGNPKVSAMVATVTQEPDGNIILVPTIVGHVVNFGDTSRVAQKFALLREFYRRVSPVKGWNTYDTIAVKWRGQVVATRCDKRVPELPVPTEEEMTGSLDIDDNEPSPSDTVIVSDTPQIP